MLFGCLAISWLEPKLIAGWSSFQKMVVYDDIAENKIAIYDKGIDRMANLGEHMDFESIHILI